MPSSSSDVPATTPMAGLGGDFRLSLPRIEGRATWPDARFQLRNWMRMHDLLDVVTDSEFSLTTNNNQKRNEKIFGIIASQCTGEALAIAQGLPEGDGRSLFLHFDHLWRSSLPASLVVCVKTLTSSTLKDPAKFESYLAERSTAARRLAEGDMKLPEQFLAICLLISLASCPQLANLQTIHALETTSESDLTVEKVTNAARQLLQVTTASQPDEDELAKVRRREQVLVTQVKSLEAQLAGSMSDVLRLDTQAECFFCHKPGHRAAECRKLRSEYSKMNNQDKEKWERYYKVTPSAKVQMANVKPSKPAVTDML